MYTCAVFVFCFQICVCLYFDIGSYCILRILAIYNYLCSCSKTFTHIYIDGYANYHNFLCISVIVFYVWMMVYDLFKISYMFIDIHTFLYSISL
jgi:hypothetical protein